MRNANFGICFISSKFEPMNNLDSIRNVFDWVCKSLQSHCEQEEIPYLAYLILEELSGLNRTEIIADKPFVYTDNFDQKLKTTLNRLKKGEPVQYIFNNAWFGDLSFYVNENVLIPRQETEELVDLVIRSTGKIKKKILDIGTGSGCIPVSLKNKVPQYEISACDISEKALEVAVKNAQKNGAQVDFFICDILNDIPKGVYDIVISNPPYIPLSEREEMASQVKDKEPGLALFVKDADPLLFYREILKKSRQILKPKGKVFFELHEIQGELLPEMAQTLGFSCMLYHDLNGKLRMAELELF